MTTNHVVADGIEKRKPTPQETEMFFGTRLPELITRFISGGVNPSGMNDTIKLISDGAIITASKEVVVTPPKPKREKFDPFFEIEIIMPEDYNSDTELDTFKAAHEAEFAYYNQGAVSANFRGVSHKLVAGKKYLVKGFAVKKKVSSEDCIEKVRTENGHLVGAQGWTVLYQQKKDKFPKGKAYLSFDEKEKLPLLGGHRRVPDGDVNSDGTFEFYLGDWEGDWYDDCVLLVFCDVPQSSGT